MTYASRAAGEPVVNALPYLSSSISKLSSRWSRLSTRCFGTALGAADGTLRNKVGAGTGPKRRRSRPRRGTDTKKHPIDAVMRPVTAKNERLSPSSEAEVQIVPRRARKARAELVIEANLVVIFERLPHRRHQHVAAVLHRQPSPDGNADNVFGEPRDEFDHKRPLE